MVTKLGISKYATNAFVMIVIHNVPRWQNSICIVIYRNINQHNVNWTKGLNYSEDILEIILPPAVRIYGKDAFYEMSYILCNVTEENMYQ